MKIQAPPPGTLLAGKYLVEGLLGVGGMGVVLTARHQQLDQKVAIKVLLPEVAKHPEVVERFAREARAAAKIQGEHVARVVDVGQLDDGSPFMVMEHLEGRDLAAELRARGPLPVAEVAHWIVEACEAIAQAHAAKIVHRDLKPSNLFLARQPDSRSVVKVLDFGISKIVDPDAPALTKTSSLVGTPYYMSPEQLTAAKTLDTRADIWALGVIMYELLVGTPPFIGESMPEVVAGILQNGPVPIDVARPGLPLGFGDIIAFCMQTKPSDRYQSVAEVAAALAQFGTSRDQLSAERIARVLGIVSEEPIPPTEPAPPGVGASSAGRMISNAPPVERTLLLSEPPRSPHNVIGEAKTEIGVATSVNELPITHGGASDKRFRPIAIVAGVALLLGIGAWVIAAPHNNNTSSSVRPDNGGTSTTTTTIATAISASNMASSSAVAPIASAVTPPTIPSTSPSASAPALPASHHVVVPTRPNPSASSVTPVVVVPSASAAAPPSPSKNPFDMGIK